MAVDSNSSAKIPPALLEACEGVTDIPSKDLSIKEAGSLWGEDRKNLGDCQARHKGLADAVRVNEQK